MYKFTKCGVCNGTGVLHNSDYSPCFMCDGVGVVSTPVITDLDIEVAMKFITDSLSVGFHGSRYTVDVSQAFPTKESDSVLNVHCLIQIEKT